MHMSAFFMHTHEGMHVNDQTHANMNTHTRTYTHLKEKGQIQGRSEQGSPGMICSRSPNGDFWVQVCAHRQLRARALNGDKRHDLCVVSLGGLVDGITRAW